jgi:hypothetical protein
MKEKIKSKKRSRKKYHINKTQVAWGLAWGSSRDPYFEDRLALLYGYFSDDNDSETTYKFIMADVPKGKMMIRHNSEKCDNYQWMADIISFFYLGSRCPICQESKGERIVRNFLLENNFIFERQFKFIDLLSEKGYCLKFDFAIFSDENKNFPLFLIEYDGEYHCLEDIQSKTKLKITKERDLLKDEYCKEHNVNLIRIPYWEKENIEKILEKKIFGIEQ